MVSLKLSFVNDLSFFLYDILLFLSTSKLSRWVCNRKEVSDFCLEIVLSFHYYS